MINYKSEIEFFASRVTDNHDARNLATQSFSSRLDAITLASLTEVS